MRKITFKKQGVQNMSIPMKTIPGYYNERPGIQVGTKMEGEIFLSKHDAISFYHTINTPLHAMKNLASPPSAFLLYC